jgi:hypothetical protein
MRKRFTLYPNVGVKGSAPEAIFLAGFAPRGNAHIRAMAHIRATA